MDKLKEWWSTLEPSKQKWVILGGVAGVIVLFAVFAGNSGEKREITARPEKPETTILGNDRGEADLAALNAKVKTLEDLLQTQTRDRDELQQRVTRLQGALGSLTQLQQNPEQIANLIDEQARLRADLDLLQSGGVRTGGSESGTGADPFAGSGQAPSGESSSDLLDPLERVRTPNRRGVAEPEAEVPQIMIDGQTGRDGRTSRAAPSRTRGNPTQTARDRRAAGLTEGEDTVFLPSGSLFQGVLLNGMDAPTGRGSSSQPFPVTIRLTSLAFLPNKYSTNVRECMVVAAGVGRLDDERVHLRTERLSCITTDSMVIDIPLEGYVTGEDGKVGLRGTVVERTGALLAKTALAGLASGLSTALQPRITASVQTGANAGGIEFTQPDLADIGEAAAYSGVATAMDELARFYLDRAQQVFPVIELDAMRTVTVHLTKGVGLKMTDGAKWSQQVADAGK